MPNESGPPPLPPPVSAPPPPRGGGAVDPTFGSGETMFFQRREKRKFPLLPWLVIVVLVFGTLALVLWGLNRSRQPAETNNGASNSKPVDPSGGRPVLTPEEARRQAEQSVVVATPTPTPTATAAPTAGRVASPTPAVANASPSPEVRRATPVNPGEGDRPPTVPDDNSPLNFDLRNAENSQVKNDVLQRIDLAPDVSREMKDKLYASVDRARGMGRLITIPFDKGRATVSDADVARLRQQLQRPEIQKLTDDPTVVLVVLGYADPGGSPEVNREISRKRARSVLEALRDRLNVLNTLREVAMGGSTLFSQQQAEKNRVVEVWAVLP
ncbi:MAG: hypothetical protein JO117_07525 [Verrucomicrobia bacterium]|nr:hypothetical protein [Verrucomicrobiota bacterium]